ncbi:general odorant-binding protein 70-like [Agrilus planipennis]|nr:general odorant-binding protein 70-like [Agrilus planipennis]XP_025833602.1 general odorant-binding protein 70-like [Agrilus planipennis]
MKAVNEFGFPRPDGLVTLYTEGVTDPEYIKGTFRAVNSCLANAKKTYATTLESVKDDGTTCDVAFYTFDCISDLIDEYCKQNP